MSRPSRPDRARGPGAWSLALRVLLVTDGRAEVRRIESIVAAAAAGGIRAVQVREPALSARELAALCGRLTALLEPMGGLVIVNDRADVAAAGFARGVHVGRRSVPWPRVRGLLPAGASMGCSAHDRGELEAAAAAGADYATLSPVLATSCKPGATPLGPRRAADLTAVAELPVLWLGGLDAVRLREMEPTVVPDGVAVRSAVFASRDPAGAAAEIVAAVADWWGTAGRGAEDADA